MNNSFSVNFTMERSNDSIEAPSPAPAPLLSSEDVIITAEEFKRYNSFCTLNGTTLTISINDNLRNDHFKLEINEGSSFWNENSIYFQNILQKLHDLLNQCFNGDNTGIQWNFINVNDQKIEMDISYGGLFGFNVRITIPKEEQDNNCLTEELKTLHEKNKKLEMIINKMINQTDIGDTIINGSRKNDLRESLGFNSTCETSVNLKDIWKELYNS